MRRWPLYGLVIALATAGCTSANLAGNWAPPSAQLGGEDFPVSNFAGATLKLTESAYEFGGDKGTIAVIPKHTPAQMDIHGVQGPNKGRTIPAIYQLSSDSLVVCYQLGAGDRPKTFTSPKDSQVLLIRYKRVK